MANIKLRWSMLDDMTPLVGHRLQSPGLDKARVKPMVFPCMIIEQPRTGNHGKQHRDISNMLPELVIPTYMVYTKGDTRWHVYNVRGLGRAKSMAKVMADEKASGLSGWGIHEFNPTKDSNVRPEKMGEPPMENKPPAPVKATNGKVSVKCPTCQNVNHPRPSTIAANKRVRCSKCHKDISKVAYSLAAGEGIHREALEQTQPMQAQEIPMPPGSIPPMAGDATVPPTAQAPGGPVPPAPAQMVAPVPKQAVSEPITVTPPPQGAAVPAPTPMIAPPPMVEMLPETSAALGAGPMFSVDELKEILAPLHQMERDLLNNKMGYEVMTLPTVKAMDKSLAIIVNKVQELYPDKAIWIAVVGYIATQVGILIPILIGHFKKDKEVPATKEPAQKKTTKAKKGK